MEQQNTKNQNQQEQMEIGSSEEIPKHSEDALKHNEGDPKHREEVQNHSLSEEELQQKRFIARERFLRLMLAAENSKCKLQMYENTTVEGLYVSADITFENVIIKDLQTPIAVYENACLRTSDIISMKLDIEL